MRIHSTPVDLQSPPTLSCRWSYTENHHQVPGCNSAPFYCWRPVDQMVEVGERNFTGCTVRWYCSLWGMNLLTNAVRRETREPKMESGIYLPSSRGFMDDLTLTTTTHVQARWMLTALTDVASWGRMKLKTVKSRPLVIKTGHTTERFKLYVQNDDSWKMASKRLTPVDYMKSSNKNIEMSSFNSSKTFKRKRMGQTDLFRITNPLQ